MDITRTDKNTMPEQVQENMDNIKVVNDKIDARPVGLIDKGTWTRGRHYYPQQVVYYDGTSYVCIASIISLRTPDIDTIHFKPFARQGEQGEQGETGATGNGISSITLISSVGLVDTYRIAFTDGTHYDYTVTNGQNGTNGTNGQDGNGISSITLISTVGLVDTYRIAFTDGTHYDYTVTNGQNGTNGTNGQDGNGIVSITKTGTSGNVDTYTITFTNGTTTTFTVTNAIDDDFHALTFKDEVKTPHTSSQNLSSLLGGAYVSGATYELYGYCSAYAGDSRNASLYTDIWNTNHDVNINTLSNSRIQQWAFTIPAKTNITMVSNSTFTTFVFTIYGYRRIK